ncbi:hypothetical protein B0H10DRAFT_2101723 [Mycena sp. CBHHK59/15]|nr:hypothetical protein B0H10DRAFT_2101723 [Mycena sp. CBHHK59/15]
MMFPFSRLPTELALEIVRVAALPSYEDKAAPRPSYATARSLAAVSHAIRSATMPHLLHSVVLASPTQALYFIDAILLQKQLSARSSPLALDYTALVRRFWSTECWEPMMDDLRYYDPDYGALYEIIRGVDALGLNFRALNVLYNGLASACADPVRDWTCRRVTFAGELSRWRPLTSNTAGLAFLGHVTHLTLWIPTHDDPPQPSPVPSWVQAVPFAAFHSLTHVAFPLLTNRRRHKGWRGRKFFYVPPSDDPLSRGVVVPLRVLPSCLGESPDLGWETPFILGESDGVWADADQLRGACGDGGDDMDWE